MLLFLFGATEARSEEPTTPAPRVVAIEWIPLHAHTAVLEAFAKAHNDYTGSAWTVNRIVALGDEQELQKSLDRVVEEKPDFVLGFGDHVCTAVRAKCPAIPLLAVFVRRPDALEKGTSAPVAILDSEPSPEIVWELAAGLCPTLSGLGVLFTQEYAPNVGLAARLAKVAGSANRQLVEITVDEGYCRTDSDFERALSKGGSKRTPFEVLFVPDDPNGSRFGNVIYSAADRLGIVAIGTEATLGKGCVAALLPDYDALGQELARLCREGHSGRPWPKGPVAVPRLVSIDEAVAKRKGLKLASGFLQEVQAMAKSSSEH